MNSSEVQNQTEFLNSEKDARIAHLESIVYDVMEKQKTGKIVEFEYDHVPQKRPISTSAGGRRVLEIVASNSGRFINYANEFAQFIPDLEKISSNTTSPIEPFWTNGWFPILDAISLYSFIRIKKPIRYIEIGSGNSTKFARRAISDGGLNTKIISIDPYPRAEIDKICDICIRSKLEDFDISQINGFSDDDILFIDSSHRVSQGCDVVIFFTEILPALPPGMIYGIHDILLPDSDYPESWLDRHYGEQYLLASYLSGGADGDNILFPSYYVGNRREKMLKSFSDFFSNKRMSVIDEHIYGFSFWLKKREK